jgi:hypothetical protein
MMPEWRIGKYFKGTLTKFFVKELSALVVELSVFSRNLPLKTA